MGSLPVQACPLRTRHPAFFFDAPPLCCEGWGYNILMKKEADMAIHSSQSSVNLLRLPRPTHPYALPRFRVTLVRDNRAVPPSSPLTTSVAAAAIFRPLFAGLDQIGRAHV